MKVLLIGLIVLGSISAFGKNNLTKNAIEQNSITISEYQIFLEGQTNSQCSSKDKGSEVVNVFKGASYPSVVYSCGSKKMTFTFECKGNDLEEKCKIDKVVIK